LSTEEEQSIFYACAASVVDYDYDLDLSLITLVLV